MISEKELMLVVLMEECAEVSQRASKAVRFGIDEVQEGQEQSNFRRLNQEYNDLLATAERLGLYRDGALIREKNVKLDKYLAYSKRCRTVHK